MVRRASRLIEGVILTRPGEDNRGADDGRNRETAEVAGLRPKHRPAHRPERDGADFVTISHERSSVPADRILDYGRHHRTVVFWNWNGIAKSACYYIQHVERV